VYFSKTIFGTSLDAGVFELAFLAASWDLPGKAERIIAAVRISNPHIFAWRVMTQVLPFKAIQRIVVEFYF
jgi:hypothetical protein